MSEFINTIDILGDEAVATSIVDRSITEFKDDVLTEVGTYAFQGCSSLATVALPNCKKIGTYSFSGCSALTEVTDEQFASLTQISNKAFESTKIKKVSLSKLTSLGNAFAGLTSIAEIRLQAIKTLTNQCFRQCYGSIKLVDLGACTYIDGYTFYGCPYIKNLVLRSETLCALASYTGLCGFSGSTTINTKIYVPRALVDSYKAATNWSTYADKFRALEDYTVDGTVTGELDETKI